MARDKGLSPLGETGLKYSWDGAVGPPPGATGETMVLFLFSLTEVRSEWSQIPKAQRNTKPL